MIPVVRLLLQMVILPSMTTIVEYTQLSNNIENSHDNILRDEDTFGKNTGRTGAMVDISTAAAPM